MRSADSPHTLSKQQQLLQEEQQHSTQHHHHHRHHHQHHHRQHSRDGTTSRSAGRRSKQRHHQQQHTRRRHESNGGNSDAGDCGADGDCSLIQSAAPPQSPTAAPSLIDQLLINSVASKPTSVCSTSIPPPLQQQHLEHLQQQSNDFSHSLLGRSTGPSSHGRTAEGAQIDPATAEAAAGKALARQWEISKQFVVATLINCLSHRMRDLQRTDELLDATEKIGILAQLRRLMASVRSLELVKTVYSSGKRAKQAEAAVGLTPRSVPADLLQKWSSRENEYHVCWMALLEKSVDSLTRCQEAETLRSQLAFAQSVVDVYGFPV